MGELLGIVTRERSRAPMKQHSVIEISVDRGLCDDSRGASRGRNVTVLGREGWQAACAELGRELPWTTRRANLLVEGVDLIESGGARIRIGEVVLLVTEECEPCQRMDEQSDGLRAALGPEWRAGVSCRVLTAGQVRIGDATLLER